MSKVSVNDVEAFFFPTHFAGDISPRTGLRFHAFRGADLVQATEGVVIYEEGADGPAKEASATVKLRDAFTSVDVDNLAERVCPAYKALREFPDYSITHHLSIACDLGSLTVFCKRSAATQCIYSVRFHIAAAHACLTLYANAGVVAVGRWDCVKGNNYCHSIITAEGKSTDKSATHPPDALTQLMMLPAQGFATAAAILAKMNPAAALPSLTDAEPLSPNDIRELN
jgi:hypothetical protein